MNKKKVILLVVAVSLVLAGITGGAVWWTLKPKATPEALAEKEASKPGPDYRYVTLDKVLIMLRNQRGEAVTHYMAIDLVFKTLPESEKRTKDHLPLLRTVAVKALSSYTVEAATAMTVDQFASELNKAYGDAYAAEHRDAPFAEALIGKLIIE
jgi:flagellar FliL protein